MRRPCRSPNLVRRTVRLPPTASPSASRRSLGWLAVAPLPGPAGHPRNPRSSGVVARRSPPRPSQRRAAAPPASAAASPTSSPRPSPARPRSDRDARPAVLPGRPAAVQARSASRSLAPSATPRSRPRLDARLEALRKRAGIPGMSAAILFADGTRWTGTAGYADVAARRPVTADTGFAVASVSKTFTAALIMGLVEDGTLGLDDSARTYLPSLPSKADHDPRAARPHERAARLLLRAGVDHALLSKPTRSWDPGPFAQVRRQAVLQARRVVALLEHELPGPRDRRRGRRPGDRRRPAAYPVPRAARARSHVLPGSREAARPARPRLSLPGNGRDAARDRPVGRDGGRAVHVGRDRGRRRGLDRHDGDRPCLLGPGAVRR